MKQQIAILDDEKTARQLLRTALSQRLLARGLEARIVEYNNGETLLADVEEGYENFDLYFLDIFLEGMSGMRTARELRKQHVDAPVVFLSTSDEFAVESYEVEAAGYLLKPLDIRRLDRLLVKLLGDKVRRRVSLRCGRELRNVYLDEMSWLESRGNIVRIHMADGSVLETREKLSVLEEAMDDRRFLRCHQSFLVNMAHVDAAKNDFQMQDGTVIPIRVRTHKQILNQYYDWFVSNTLDGAPGGIIHV